MVDIVRVKSYDNFHPSTMDCFKEYALQRNLSLKTLFIPLASKIFLTTLFYLTIDNKITLGISAAIMFVSLSFESLILFERYKHGKQMIYFKHCDDVQEYCWSYFYLRYGKCFANSAQTYIIKNAEQKMSQLQKTDLNG